MNRNLNAIFAIAVVCLAFPGFGAAQDKKIHLVKGQKLVLKGSVAHGRDRSYFFKARKGQSLTVTRRAVMRGYSSYLRSTISTPNPLAKTVHHGPANYRAPSPANTPSA